MATIISVLIIVVCALLILVVLIQNSKGGGLASSFSSSNQVMGVRKTADFLEKATWTLAASLLVLCILSTSFNKTGDVVSGGTSKESVTRQKGAEDTSPKSNSNNTAPLTPGAPVNPAPGK